MSYSIVDMFKKQAIKNVTCPGCNAEVPKQNLNSHLDFECRSANGNLEVTNDFTERKSDSVDASGSVQSHNVHVLFKSQSQSDVGENAKGAKSKEVKSAKAVGKPEACQAKARNIKKKAKADVAVRSPADNRGSSRPSRWAPDLTNFKRKRQKSTEDRDPAPNESDPLSVGEMNELCDDSDLLLDADSVLEQNGSSVVASGFSQSTVSQNSNSADVSKNGTGADDSGPQGDKKQYMPYYIANFTHIVNEVLEDIHNKHLFNETDLQYVKTYFSMSDAAQKLYVRLFQRKYQWLRPVRINYSEIGSDLSVYLEELVRCGLLDSGADCIDLETALNLLSLSESKSLSKQFNFNTSCKSKTEIKQLLVNHAKQHKSFFSSGGDQSISSAILKKVKQIMGPCFRLSLEPKRLFTRILMLFSLPTMAEDDEEAAGGQQQQLLTLLFVKKGELKFAEYSLNKQWQIFENRDKLICYEVARQLENDILNAVEAKKFELARELYAKAKVEYSDICSASGVKRDESMPFFLRRYTAGHVYVRCLYQGVEILQRLRLYQEAVEQLRELLVQRVYCQDRRGMWYDRLVLNLEQHLKQPDEAAAAIKEGLRDSYVRVGPRFSLLIRAERLVKTKCSDNDELKSFVQEISAVIEAPKVIVHGRLLPRPIPGRRHIFISSNASSEDAQSNEVTVLAVEQLALEHYSKEGYPQGLHGEGSTFISLFALLLWDIIYDGNIADAFISPYQTHPLDLNSNDFYDSRKDQFTKSLDVIRTASTEALKEIVRSAWEAHRGIASLVSWDNFADSAHIEGLVGCFGSHILAGICERIAKDFRFTRSGVPDLVVWNPETQKVKIVEVKGPGDKLSSKQILWLDYLIKLGADAEVCLVTAVGAKKLRKI